MRRFFFFIFNFLGFAAPSVKAQQLPLLTYYREHHSLINPGAVYYENYTGNSAPNLSAGVSYRHQWIGVQGAPRTFTARFEHIMPDKNMLYGIALVNDEIGVTGLSGAYFRYAYQIRSEEHPNSFISGGLNIGFLQYRYQPDKGKTKDAQDPFTSYRQQQGVFDVSAGVFASNELQNDDVLYYGVSVPQLIAQNFAIGRDSALSRYKHYYVLLGYYHFFGDGGDPVFRSFIEPSVWLRYVPNVPLQMDANIRVNISQFWVGAGMAMTVSKPFNFDIMHAETGVRLNIGEYNILKVGYGFDITMNNASTHLGATHEINLVYSWKQ